MTEHSCANRTADEGRAGAAAAGGLGRVAGWGLGVLIGVDGVRVVFAVGGVLGWCGEWGGGLKLLGMLRVDGGGGGGGVGGGC